MSPTNEQILAELRAHEGLIRDGCYIPSKHEVATWSAVRLNWHLLGWWWESPSSLIPNDEQVAESVAVLRARPDAGSAAIQKLIAQAPPPSDSEGDRRVECGSRGEVGEGD
jgi:hypothetical protein